MNWNCLWEIKATQRVNISFRSWCCHLRSPWRPTIESHTQRSLTRGTHWFLRLRGLQEGTGSTLILGRIPGNFWPTYYYIYFFFFKCRKHLWHPQTNILELSLPGPHWPTCVYLLVCQGSLLSRLVGWGQIGGVQRGQRVWNRVRNDNCLLQPANGQASSSENTGKHQGSRCSDLVVNISLQGLPVRRYICFFSNRKEFCTQTNSLWASQYLTLRIFGCDTDQSGCGTDLRL